MELFKDWFSSPSKESVPAAAPLQAPAIREPQAGGEEQDDPLAALNARHQKEILALKTRAALEIALHKAGARDTRTVLPLLDLASISLGEGGLTGLSEQLSSLRQTAAYLFSFDNAPRSSSGGTHGTAPDSAPDTLGGALSEYYQK